VDGKVSGNATGAACGNIDELKLRDEWLKLFMPQGVFLAGRIDNEHWLTCGCDEEMSLLAGSAVGTTIVLMAADKVDAPVRFGVFSPVGSDKKIRPSTKASAQNRAQAAEQASASARIGWAPLPPGYELRLRQSGLLWPEAAHRLANAAYVTRERLGRGQIILFAAPPAFRGAAWGTTRILLNAMIYGPGMGASHPVKQL
jgi:hypothetical protein